VDDAVPQTARRPGLHRAIVGIDHPVDGAVADGVRADVDARVVQLGGAQAFATLPHVLTGTPARTAVSCQ